MAEETQVTLSHDDTARNMIVRIMAILSERLPELAGKSTGERRRLTNAASVPDEFLEQIGIAVDNSPGASTLHEITSAETRDMIVFSRVYFAFGDQIEQIGRSIKDVVTERRHNLGQRALAVYASMKGANRPGLKPTVSNAAALRRALGRTRGSRRKTADVPVPGAPDSTLKEKK